MTTHASIPGNRPGGIPVANPAPVTPGNIVVIGTNGPVLPGQVAYVTEAGITLTLLAPPPGALPISIVNGSAGSIDIAAGIVTPEGTANPTVLAAGAFLTIQYADGAWFATAASGNGGGGSGITIGEPVTGATPSSLLVSDGSGDLASGPQTNSVVRSSSPPASAGLYLQSTDASNADAEWAAGPSGSGAPVGWKSLQNDFSLTPVTIPALGAFTSSASDSAITAQTTAIQNALNACVSAGYGLDFGADLWAINATLTSDGPTFVRATGASEIWGNGYAAPNLSPFVQGGGLMMTAPATDIFAPNGGSGSGSMIYVAGSMLFQFAKTSSVDGSTAIAFQDTGHGINATNGSPFAIDNAIVFGHDGNHYGYKLTNCGYGQITSWRSYGGGGLQSVGCGNVCFDNTLFGFVLSGSAHGIWQTGQVSSFQTWKRPQVYAFNVAGSALAAAYGITSGQTPPSGSQYNYLDPLTTVASGSNGATIATLTTLNLASVVGFTASPGSGAAGGYVIITTPTGYAAFTYTGISGNELTGVTLVVNNTGLTTLATGMLVGAGTQWMTLIAPDFEPPSQPCQYGIDTNVVGSSYTYVSNKQNTQLGTNALAGLTTGTDSVAIGYQAGLAVTAGGAHVLAGYQAGATMTTDTNNVAIGNKAMQLAAGGSGSVAIGTEAGQNATVTITAIGYTAAMANTSGSHNTAIGYQALLTNQAGQSNTAIGYAALATFNTSGSTVNTAIGASALTALTTGTNNTAIGASALAAATTSIANTAVGANSLSAVTTNSENTAVGQNALESATGSHNTAIGQSAGSASSSTSQMTAIGASTVVGGNYATALGYGATANAAGAVAIGADSGGTSASTSTANTIQLGTANHILQHSGPKVGLYGATPVAQPLAIAQVATTAPTNSTPYGYSTSAQAAAIVTAVNAILDAIGAAAGGIGITA